MDFLSYRFSPGFLYIVGGLFSVAAFAETEITPSVFSQYTYDSNVFRLKGKEEAPQLKQLDDRVSSIGAGLNVQTNYRSYVLDLRASLQNHDYEYQDLLDNQSSDVLLGISGESGRDLDYRISWKKSERLTDFTGENSNFSFRNLVTQTSLNTVAQYAVSARWGYEVSLRREAFTYTHPNYYVHNRDTYESRLAAKYSASSLSMFTGFFNLRADNFPERSLSSQNILDTRYFSFEAGTRAEMVLSGSSTVIGSMALKARRHYNKTARNYLGPMVDLKYRWTPLHKLHVSMTYAHDTQPVELVAANYMKTDRLAWEAEWAMKHNLWVKMSASQMWYEYSLTESVGRKDENTNIQLGLKYDLLSKLQASINAQQTLRSSTDESYGFEDNLIYTSLSLEI